MGDVANADTVDRNILVARITKSDGTISTVDALTTSDSLSSNNSGNVRRFTHGQILTLGASNDDGGSGTMSAADSTAGRLTESGSTYLFLSYEIDKLSSSNDEKAQIRAYKFPSSLGTGTLSSVTPVELTFRTASGGNRNTIDSFGISELGGGEIVAHINSGSTIYSYDLTVSGSAAGTSSESIAVNDNRPGILDTSSNNAETFDWRDNSTSEFTGTDYKITTNGSSAFMGKSTTFHKQEGAGFMDVAFIADNQNSLLKVLDISEKSESDLKAQRNIMVQYNSNNVGTIQSISVDHPNEYYRQKAGDSTDAISDYRDSAYLYLISDDGTNGGLMRLNATDPLASGIGTVPATGKKRENKRMKKEKRRH